MRYHINDKGDAGRCQAKLGKCPYGNELEHYTTPEDARTAFAKVMSGAPWTGHRKEKRAKWKDRSWAARRAELTTLTRDLCSRNGLSGIEIRWEPQLESKEQIALGIWKYGGASLKERYVRFSQKVEAMSEEEAKENVIHEVAHLLTATEHEVNGGHTEVWRAKCEELAASIPGMEDWYFEDGSQLSSETLVRIQAHLKLAVAPRWRGTCENGHEIKTSYPPIRDLSCSACLLLPPRGRKYFSWEEL